MQNILSALFTKKEEDILAIKHLSDATVFEKLFAFLNQQIVDEEIKKNYSIQYQQLQTSTGIEKEIALIKLYKKYEEFLTENSPPLTQKKYTSGGLRQEIQTIVPKDKLSEAFQVFITDKENIQDLILFILPMIGHYMASGIGLASIKEVMQHITPNTIFDGMEVAKDSIIIPESSIGKITGLNGKEVHAIIRAFFDTWYRYVQMHFGKEQARRPFLKVYEYIKSIFPFDVTFLLVELLPEEIFEEEVLEAKSKKDLEKILQEKTLQLENVKKLLEQKVNESTHQNQKLEEIKKSMISLLADIQASKEKEEEEKARNDALLETIGEGMIALNKQNRIILMNKQAVSLLQYTKEELLGKEIGEVVALAYETGESVPFSQRPEYQALTYGKKISLLTSSLHPMYYVRKDTTRFPAVITSTPVVINNAIVGTITVFRDSAREEEVERMKTEFISLASHQLRTPLSRIKWFGEMLLAGDAGTLTSEQRDFVNNIAISTGGMIELVDSLLNISRIESGKIVIDPKPTNMKDFIGGIITELSVEIQEKHLNIIFNINGELPNVIVDQRLIRQVYVNLLRNAIKYSPDGSEISVSVSQQGEEILSQVADHGYGIPKKQQEKIFHKFFRAENAVRIETDGNGLGLYLVKAIIESLHGKIWFESEENNGTTFSFTLPARGISAKVGEVTLV